MNDNLLIGIDASNGVDRAILTVGRRKRPNGSLEIVNVFRGEEALDLYKKIVTKAEGKRCEDCFHFEACCEMVGAGVLFEAVCCDLYIHKDNVVVKGDE